jgi:hypothetical protein
MRKTTAEKENRTCGADFLITTTEENDNNGCRTCV